MVRVSHNLVLALRIGFVLELYLGEGYGSMVEGNWQKSFSINYGSH